MGGKRRQPSGSWLIHSDQKWVVVEPWQVYSSLSPLDFTTHLSLLSGEIVFFSGRCCGAGRTLCPLSCPDLVGPSFPAFSPPTLYVKHWPSQMDEDRHWALHVSLSIFPHSSPVSVRDHPALTMLLPSLPARGNRRSGFEGEEVMLVIKPTPHCKAILSSCLGCPAVARFSSPWREDMTLYLSYSWVSLYTVPEWTLFIYRTFRDQKNLCMFPSIWSERSAPISTSSLPL